MRAIDSACNYRGGEEDEPKHICGPFYSLSDEEQGEGKTIGGEWPRIEEEARQIVEKHSGVTVLGTDTDTSCHIGFLDIGCDDPAVLLACLVELSGIGFCTGVL